ncbi:growth/differentiation factor 8 [Aplysia californica]|uniref:Growth/differentiation factor 8 n=1 Tax=Aplysia californica TaxID=6500 RepID=A0ABM1VQ40_APLCA|nr:growth/differentiation factor 8 [Aplysia californica]
MTTILTSTLSLLPVILLTVVCAAHSMHSKARGHVRVADELSNNAKHSAEGTRTSSFHQRTAHEHPRRHPRVKEEIKEKYYRYEPSTERDSNSNNKMTSSVGLELDGGDLLYATRPTMKSFQKHKVHKQSYSENLSHNFGSKSKNHDIEESPVETNVTESVSEPADSANSTEPLPDPENSLLSQLEQDDKKYTSGNESLGNHSKANMTKSISKASQCPSCEIRNGDKNYRIESLKQQILSTLQFKKLPNTTGISMPKVPALEHLYGMDADMVSDAPYRKRTNGYAGHYREEGDEDDFIVKTERVFTAARISPMSQRLNLTDSVYFSPPIHLYISKIKTAYLWFYIRRQDIRRPYITLTVERILPESLPDNRIVAKPIFSQKLFRDKAFGWKRIDMRDTLSRWVRHPMSNYGLLLRAEDDHGNNLVVLPPSPDIDKGYEPWLDTKIMEPRSHSRHRRSDSLVCSRNSTESRCCRFPLFVGFAEFGWDWVIAPTHVKVDYCSGECRMTMQGTSLNSWVNQQVPGVGDACCAPSKMSPLPLLYFDEDMNILYQILQNIKVDKCACA